MATVSDTDMQKITQWLGDGAINIFGLPFSGKDTHGHVLAEQFNATLLSSGAIFRGSHMPPHAKEILDAGGIVPSDVFVDMVLPYLSKPEFRDRPMILSSVGRSHGEEDGVLQAAAAAGHPIKAVVLLAVDEATSRERFANSRTDANRDTRADDAESKLDTRYTNFRQKTQPVIDYYREHGLLIEIDGIPPIEEVNQTILRALLERARAAN